MQNDIISTIKSRLIRDGIPINWYSGRRVLVTGGAGFIGSWLVEILSFIGAKVYVVDNLWRGSIKNLTMENGDFIIPMEEQFIFGDLCDYEVAVSAYEKSKPEIIFHLADVVAGIDYVFSHEASLFRSNLLINSNVITAARKFNTPIFIYLATACSYPKHLQYVHGMRPLVEEDIYPANPESAYGWSKLLGEYELELTAKNSNIQIGILRLHNVYGPRSIMSLKRSQVIPSLIRKAIRYPQEDFVVWGSGKQSRDFVFVGDVIDAILRIPLKGLGKGTIQIGTEKETSVAELAQMIVKLSGKNIIIRFDTSKPEGDFARSGSFNIARQLLGWEVSTCLIDGLTHTYNWAHTQICNGQIDFDD